VATPPLGSPCDGLLTYPGDIKTLVKSSKERSGPTLRIVTAKSQIYVGFGTGNSSLFWTGLIAHGKSGYFTVCLDLKVILLCLLKYQSDEWPFGSLQTMGTAKGI